VVIVVNTISSFFNSINIRKKVLFISLIGVIVPIIVVYLLLVGEIKNEYEERQQLFTEQGLQRIDERVQTLFDNIDKLTYTYVADLHLNALLEDTSITTQYEALKAQQEIEEKINAHLFSYNYLESIAIYHNNEFLGETSELHYYNPDLSLTDSELGPNHLLLEDLMTFIENQDMYLIKVHGNDIYVYRKLFGRDLARNNVLVIKLNRQALFYYLHDNFHDNYKGISYLLDSDGKVLASSSKNVLPLDKTGIQIPEAYSVIEKPFTMTPYISNWSIMTVYKQKNIYETQKPLFIKTCILLIIVILLSLIIFSIIGHTVTNRLRSFVSIIASNRQSLKKDKGSMELRTIEYRYGKDEIGQTMEAYNEMVYALNHTINELEAAEEEARALLSEKISANEELAAINEELSNLNEELTASYEEINSQDQQINALVYKDNLTGLKNRQAITETINNTLNKNPGKQSLAIVFLDIDNFKYINDTHGHEIGDMVIKETGSRLRAHINEQVSIGRFGGDEFLILIKENASMEAIDTVVRQLRASFVEPLVIDHNKFYLTVSMGISLYPKDGLNQNELVKKADQALYEAKDSGRNKYVVFDSSMSISLEDKLKFQSDIKTAFDNREFYLNYQPYFDAQSGKILGFEALIRWKSQSRGFVSPFELIVNAEEMGLIVDIGEWVFIEACNAAKYFNEVSSHPVTMSINISAVQLLDAGFYYSIMRIIDEIQVDPRLICLEMTETILINSLQKSSDLLTKFKNSGFKIALDDFGTGYSSLSYFKELPLSVLKIDKSFVDNIASSNYDRDLIQIMISIAHNKGITVTAEGVENQTQLDILRIKNCDAIQGYLLSMPIGEEDAVKKLQTSPDT